jgi:membrane protein YqaA with SNARE-associated domain
VKTRVQNGNEEETGAAQLFEGRTGSSWAGLSFGSLIGIKRSLAELGAWLMTFGAFGLFAIALLDSALIPLPSGPDLIMITLSAVNPARMPLYALAATAGSTIGCTILYLIARRAGEGALSRVSPEKRARIQNLLGRYDMLAMMTTAVLPPPFPFKPFVLGAGVFKLKTVRFVVAIMIGRAIRFLIEGWLAIEFGDDAFRIVKDHGGKVLIVVCLVLLVVLAVGLYRHRLRRSRVAKIDEAPNPQ